MEIRLSEPEIKYALAVYIFSKTGARIEVEDFDLAFQFDNELYSFDQAVLTVKE